MKKFLLFLLCIFCANIAHAQSYSIYVYRVNSNIYTGGSTYYSEDYIIKTKYCYEYALHDEAIIDFDSPFHPTLIFQNGETCDIAGIYKKIN